MPSKMEIYKAGAAQWGYEDVNVAQSPVAFHFLLSPAASHLADEDAHLPEESEGRVSCQVS